MSAGGLRYVGGSPNNYIRFNRQQYRIVGVFDGQLKIIYSDLSSQNMSWDTTESNDWTRPATLNNYLKSTYWDRMDSIYQDMVDQNHIWGIGGAVTTSLRTDYYEYEYHKVWKGIVGLVSMTDVLYASTSSYCKDTSQLTTTAGHCEGSNWLAYTQWTISRDPNSINTVQILLSDGHPSRSHVSTSYLARPVFYLKREVKITGGTGTSSDPYTLSM